MPEQKFKDDGLARFGFELKAAAPFGQRDAIASAMGISRAQVSAWLRGKELPTAQQITSLIPQLKKLGVSDNNLSSVMDSWLSAGVYRDSFPFDSSIWDVIATLSASGQTTNSALQIGTVSNGLTIVSALNAAAPLPNQGPGPHFSIEAAGRIRLTAHTYLDSTGNDLSRIRQLLPLVRQAVEELATRLSAKDNSFPALGRDIGRYLTEVSKSEQEISWGLLWGLGVRLEEAAVAAERKITDRLAPPLEDAVLSELQSLRALHAPLILATTEGRSLQDDADRVRMTRQQQSELRADAIAISDSLANDPMLIEAEAAVIVRDAARAIGEGVHPERGTTYGLSALKHVCIVATGAAVASVVGWHLGPIAGMSIWEVAKKYMAPSVAVLSDEATVIIQAGGSAARDFIRRLAPFEELVRNNDEHIRRLAERTSQLRWTIAYLDLIKSSAGDKTLPDEHDPTDTTRR